MSTVDAPRTWPAETLARVPYWVYQDEANYRAELRRIFEGPAWNYVCLESDVAQPGEYRTTFVGEMPVIVVRGEDGEIHAFENRCAHRGALIAHRRHREHQALPVRLPRLELRSPRAIWWAWPSSGARTARAACRPPSARPTTARASSHTATLCGLVFATLSDDTPPIKEYLGDEIRGRIERVLRRPVAGARPLHPDPAQQLEALLREREGHLPREPPARLLRHLPHHAPDPGRRRGREPARAGITPATPSTWPRTGRAPPIASRASAPSTRATGSTIRACSTPSTSSATASSSRS